MNIITKFFDSIRILPVEKAKFARFCYVFVVSKSDKLQKQNVSECFPDIYKTVCNNRINVFRLVSELCFFIWFKLFSSNFANADRISNLCGLPETVLSEMQ